MTTLTLEERERRAYIEGRTEEAALIWLAIGAKADAESEACADAYDDGYRDGYQDAQVE